MEHIPLNVAPMILEIGSRVHLRDFQLHGGWCVAEAIYQVTEVDLPGYVLAEVVDYIECDCRGEMPYCMPRIKRSEMIGRIESIRHSYWNYSRERFEVGEENLYEMERRMGIKFARHPR